MRTEDFVFELFKNRRQEDFLRFEDLAAAGALLSNDCWVRGAGQVPEGSRVGLAGVDNPPFTNFPMVEYHLKMNKSVPGSQRIPKEDVSSLSSNSSSSFSVAGACSSSGILFRSSGEFITH